MVAAFSEACGTSACDRSNSPPVETFTPPFIARFPSTAAKKASDKRFSIYYNHFLAEFLHSLCDLDSNRR